MKSQGEEDSMATTLHKLNSGSSADNAHEGISTWLECVSEKFWFLLSLTLFMVLGPFSGPIALIVLFKLSMEDRPDAEPEALAIH